MNNSLLIKRADQEHNKNTFTSPCNNISIMHIKNLKQYLLHLFLNKKQKGI